MTAPLSAKIQVGDGSGLPCRKYLYWLVIMAKPRPMRAKSAYHRAPGLIASESRRAVNFVNFLSGQFLPAAGDDTCTTRPHLILPTLPAIRTA